MDIVNPGHDVPALTAAALHDRLERSLFGELATDAPPRIAGWFQQQWTDPAGTAGTMTRYGIITCCWRRTQYTSLLQLVPAGWTFDAQGDRVVWRSWRWLGEAGAKADEMQAQWAYDWAPDADKGFGPTVYRVVLR